MANITKAERAKKEAEKEQQSGSTDNSISTSSTLDDSAKLKEENEELRKQLAQVLEMVKEMQNNTSNNATESASERTDEDDSDNIPVEMNARIMVTSMTTGGVNMKTGLDSSARQFRLEKLGQTIPIIYEHLINCINTDRWLFEEGLVYINNEKVVREQCLEDFYKKFLSPTTIANIMDFDVDTLKVMVSNTTREIQETLADVVAKKMNAGEGIDMNKVQVVGDSCTPPIDIRSIADKLR